MRLAFIILLWLTTINLTTAANRRPHIRRSGKGSSGGQSHQPLGSLYPQHSLVHPFLDGIEIPNWEYGGATLVTDDYIRLTPDRQSRQGMLWNKVTFEPSAKEKYPDFEAIIQFKVHGQGVKFFGDGFAYWYTKDRMQPGPVFGNQDQFAGMGIFFDTYSNTNQGRQQYISVMLGDGTQHYDHDKDGGEAKIAGCSQRFRSVRPEDPNVFVRIVYEKQILRLYLDTNGEGFEECFVVRRVFLPRGYYFGLTAATGDLADNHDIFSLKVAEPSPMSGQDRLELVRRI